MHTRKQCETCQETFWTDALTTVNGRRYCSDHVPPHITPAMVASLDHALDMLHTRQHA
jgi:hypothetical protein